MDGKKLEISKCINKCTCYWVYNMYEKEIDHSTNWLLSRGVMKTKKYNKEYFMAFTAIAF